MDLMNRVADTMEHKFIDGFTNVVNLISLFMTIAGLLIVLITQIAQVALIIIAVAIPLLYLSFISGKATYEANKEITRYQRKYKYLTTVMTGRENVDERTVFGYNEKLNDKWFEQYEISRKTETRTRAKWFVKLKSGSMITAFLCTFIAAMLINPAAAGIITIGMFFSLINATFDLVHTMSWSLTRLIEAVSAHIEYLKEITRFAAFEQYDNADAVPEGGMEFKSLEFRNVTFKYPGTETYILKCMNMKIEAGRHYAFVGANGAGKSTIAKLLTGLYQDYEGRILINGRDLGEYTAAQLKAFYSVVYQDFARYSISIRDNIAIGCVGGADDEAISNAITALKLDSVIEGLEDGKDTLLGKLAQEGKDLSGGEWQRTALARCFVSEAPIRVLDEPTAALDPIAESNLYSEFAKLCEGRTTLFFSHRLGSVKLADYIYVIDNGHVEEQGTHNELMAAKRLYHTMYDSQRRWYQ
jgi:ATP-binding cassette subfamily B protein